MDYLVRLQSRATFLPVVVSLWFLVRLWRESELFGALEVLFCAWFVVALAAQLFAHSVGLWIAGLVAQVILAISLIVKQQMDDIY